MVKCMVVIALVMGGSALGQTQSPAGCMDANAIPCTLTYANGNTLATLADGTTWATIRGADQAISFQMDKSMPVAGGFSTNVVMNLPDKGIVGGPQSAKMLVEGNCVSRTWVIDTLEDHAGKMGSGFITDAFTAGEEFERVARRVAPGSAMDLMFSTVCKQ